MAGMSEKRRKIARKHRKNVEKLREKRAAERNLAARKSVQ